MFGRWIICDIHSTEIELSNWGLYIQYMKAKGYNYKIPSQYKVHVDINSRLLRAWYEKYFEGFYLLFRMILLGLRWNTCLKILWLVWWMGSVIGQNVNIVLIRTCIAAKKAKKKLWGFNRIQTHDLRDTGCNALEPTELWRLVRSRSSASSIYTNL